MNFFTEGKTNWRYLLIVLFLAILLGVGILVWQYWGLPKEEIDVPEAEISEETTKEETANLMGFIEGSLGYPSEGIPDEMRVCTENISTKKQYCTEEHLQDKKYTYRIGYKIEVPAGDYYVFAILPSWGDYKAYYSEFVTCGLEVNCPSHEPIIVRVDIGQTVTGIDPQDWYK